MALGLIFVLLFILAVGAFSVIAVFTGSAADDLFSQAVTQIVVFGGSALLFAWLFYEHPVQYLQLAPTKRLGVKMLAAFVVLLLLLPLSDWLTRANDAMHLPHSLSEAERVIRELSDKSQEIVEGFLLRKGTGVLLANIVVLALIPAVCEELLFRGALQQILCRCFKGRQHIAILLTAAIFSLFHFELFAFLPRFMLGIALGYLFYYGGSLWVNATAHFANNAIVVVLYHLAGKGIIDIEMAESINAPWYLAFGGLALAVVVFVFVFVNKGHKSGSCTIFHKKTKKVFEY